MARCKSAKITGVAGYVPPRLLTNADLEKMVDTTNEWIMERVGIRQRHIVDKGVATSDLAAEAAKKALAERGIDGAELRIKKAQIKSVTVPVLGIPWLACA